jgi:lysophospholipase
MTETAPFHHDVAAGPADVTACWVTAKDGARLRLATWGGGTKGTVLLFPGRTEYVEKYGRAAGVLRDNGFSVIAIDWRGQGLACRKLPDRSLGHVLRFRNYQMDVAALLVAAREQGLPEPFHLLAHSMGGCIGLRALTEGLPVASAVFTAPMWGIAVSGLMRPVAWSMSWFARTFGLGHHYTPGTKPESYVRQVPFEGNMLTTDAEMFAYMVNQITKYPELALGGPSLQWLYEALKETRILARKPSPATPTLTFLGTQERIVDLPSIHSRMANWDNGRLEMVQGSEHEVMMEKPEIRMRAFETMVAHFQAHS